MKDIPVSKDFKNKATRAILAIVLFMITYLLLFALAVWLTVLCGYGGLMLIVAKPSVVTLMLGLGIAAVGVLTLFFLIKFIFTKNTTDLSQYTEITSADQPKLFALIREIVAEAGTGFPKKVYLSSEVNASVFYNSSFWSMFLPVRKNLHIGLGLVNSVTVEELRSILAHEFGHFSQRSMKVGSYVYNVNYIIHNMLYDNEGYNNFVGRIARINGWMSLPLLGSVKIVQGIQWVLQKVYLVVNGSYRALSREMEFHADEVAARIAGPSAIATSLPRMELAANAQSEVFDYYNSKIEENLRPANIFPLHLFVMQQRAERLEIPLRNGLPQITLESGARFNKSRLQVNDSWATHPDNNDRIARVKSLGLTERPSDNTHAMTLLENRRGVEEKLTCQLYSAVNWTGEVAIHPAAAFESDFRDSEAKDALPAKFKGYYDGIMLPEMSVDKFGEMQDFETEDTLFSTARVDMVYEKIALEQDLEALDAIASGRYNLKSFGYNGRQYNATEATQLAATVRRELEEVNAAVANNHNHIYRHYFAVASRAGGAAEYRRRYNVWEKYNASYTAGFDELDRMFKLCAFMGTVTPPETIENNLRSVYPHEERLKTTMLELIEDKDNRPLIEPATEEKLRTYVMADYRYFENKKYNNDAVDNLYQALHLYNSLLNRLLFLHKKGFLDYQASLQHQTLAQP